MLALLELAGMAVLPGLAASAVLYPRRTDLSFGQRMLVAIVLSWAVDAAVGLALAGAGRLLAEPVAWSLAGATVALTVAAYLRGARPATLLPELRTPERRRAAAVGLGLVLAAVCAHYARQVLQPWQESLVAWYYLGDILEIVRSAQVPTEAIDHGKTMPYEINKISWSIVLAEWLAVSSLYNAPMQAMQTAVLATVAGVTLGAWVLARSLCRTLLGAAVATVLFVLEPRMVWKLAGFRGESFGFVLFLAAAWLALRIFTGHRVRDIYVYAICLAVLATAHMVPAAVAVLWTAAVAAAAFVRNRRRALRTLAATLPAAALCVAMVLGVWAAVGRDVIGGQGALAKRTPYEPYLGADPTRAFVQLVMGDPMTPKVRRFKPADPPSFYVPPKKVLSQLAGHLRTEVPFWPNGREKAFVPFALLVLWSIRKRHGKGSDLAIVLPVLVLLLYLWGLWFSWHYHTWLPAAHPNRREFPYLRHLMAFPVALALELMLSAARDRVRGPWRRDLARLFLVAWAVAVPIRSGVQMLKKPRSMRRIRPEGLAALQWVRAHVPRDALLLTDGTTDGVVEVLAGRTSLLEGRAPYFQPDNLRYVLDVMRGAQSYFRNPRNWDYLERRGIDYVITGSGAFGARTIRRYRWHRPPPYLEWVATFGNVRIFRVPEDLRARAMALEEQGALDAIEGPPTRRRTRRTAAEGRDAAATQEPPASPIGEEDAAAVPDDGAAPDDGPALDAGTDPEANAAARDDGDRPEPAPDAEGLVPQ